MSNLMPEQRFDKNGHLVTRYVLADKASKTVSPALQAAAPVLVAKDRARLETEVYSVTEEYTDLSSFNDRDFENLTTVMKELTNPRNISVFRELMRALDPDSYIRGRQPKVKKDLKDLALYHRAGSDVLLTDTLCFTRGLHAYAPLFGGYTEEQNQVMIDVSIVAHHLLASKPDAFEYPEDGEDGEFRSDLDTYYSFFGGDIEEQQDGHLWIRNKKFVDMLERRPEDAERICEVIKQRETIQPDIIETMLDSGNHKSLIEGTL